MVFERQDRNEEQKQLSKEFVRRWLIDNDFQGKEGQIVLDQIRTIDKTRLIKLLGQITAEEQKAVLDILAEMFAE